MKIMKMWVILTEKKKVYSNMFFKKRHEADHYPSYGLCNVGRVSLDINLLKDYGMQRNRHRKHGH